MALSREQIDHIERSFKDEDKPWKKLSHSRKWLKRQHNKRTRLRKVDEEGPNKFKRTYKGWEY